MKVDLFTGGRFLFSVIVDCSVDELILVPRWLVNNASADAEGFDQLFFQAIKSSRTHLEAYEKAEVQHRATFGKNKYSSFESYKITKQKRLRK